MFKYLRSLAHAFYNWLQKITINAHQVIAHWRVRISRKQSVASTTEEAENRNVRLTDLVGKEVGQQESLEINRSSFIVGSSSQSPILPTKTPNPSRSKLYSLFRRLSVRNLMEYCVIALNEASSSSCSNKFDLSSCDQPVWLLGQQYNLPQDADKLVDDIRSKFWITYRRNFPPIDENTRYTTDRGFGCMIRCGQMVLANALLQKNLGREWRWNPDGLELNPEVYTKILKLFQDKEECPYSIHSIVRTGQYEGKVVGEWFGPNTIAQALKRISSSLPREEPNSDEVMISIDAALDNVVVIDEIKSRFRATGSSDPPASIERLSNEDGDKLEPNSTVIYEKSANTRWIPGILFIQLRLGLTKINPLYFAALKKTFQFENSLGIIGGRPNHALYLVGYTDEDIIYLDPHSTQLYIDFDQEEPEEPKSDEAKPPSRDSTYHCACPEKMPLDRLDPSLALCFYFNSEEEFDRWCRSSTDLLIKSEQAPMFEITNSRPSDWNIQLTSTKVKSGSYSNSNAKSRSTDFSKSSNYDANEKFTVLKDSVEDDSFEIKASDKNASDQSQTTNDDEEFEMLG